MAGGGNPALSPVTGGDVMVLFGFFETMVLPAFATGSGDIMMGALAIVGSAVLAKDGSWSGKVEHLPLPSRRIRKTAEAPKIVTLTDTHTTETKYDAADSQSLVLQRFSELKDYIACEPAFTRK
jgi:hypothetical protein